jgi:hypothetical protein
LSADRLRFIDSLSQVVVEAIQNCVKVNDKGLARLCQSNEVMIPPQDFKAELLFTLAHLAAYRRLRNVQLLSRSPKVQFTSYCQNVLQLSEWRNHGHGMPWRSKVA